MQNISGYVFDAYDDPTGEVLKSILPEESALPDFVKTANYLDYEAYSKLPDDNFALVMFNDGDKLRKYAMTDKGNTALSVLYFLKQAHLLPPAAVQSTAQNLEAACELHGLAPHAHLKEAAEKGVSSVSAKLSR